MSVRTLVGRHRGAAGFLGGVSTCLVLGSGVALAAIPSTATGSITACVSRSSGAVRIVDFQAGARCTTRENTVSWSKGYRYRGGWSATATYAPLDVVSHNGGSYLARVPSTAKAPGLTSYWGTLALRGAAGAAGAAGVRGLNGLPGADGTDGAAGATGPAGADGPVGATGPQGPAGVLGWEVVTKQYTVPSGATVMADTACPSGKVPVAGGAFVGTVYAGHGDANTAYVSESVIDNAGTGWLTTLVVVSPADATTFTARVVCVSAAQ